MTAPVGVREDQGSAPAAPPPGRFRLPRFLRIGSARERSISWAITGLLLLVVLAPVATVLYRGFDVSEPGEGLRFGLDNWRSIWAVPGVSEALWNTASFTIIRVALGLVLATGIAWLITRTNLPGAKWLEFGFWISFFMPTLAVVQGWIFLAGGNSGLINTWLANVPGLDRIQFDVYSYWGIIWVHLMSMNVTILVILLVPIFRNMDTTLEEAAYAAGATRWQMMLRVFLPLMRPALIFLAVLGVIKAMQSYEVERVLGGPAGIDVYATILVRMVFSEPPFVEEGSALSSLVLLVLLPLVLLQRRFTRGQHTTISSKMKTAKIDLGRWRWPAAVVVTGLVLLLTVVPLVATAAGSLMKRWSYFHIAEPWTTEHWGTVLRNDYFQSALVSTLTLGLTAGIVGAVVMYAVAYTAVRVQFKGRGLLDLASWLPWAVPGVLLSLGILTFVLDVPFLRVLHGSGVIVVVALILYSFPTGTQLLKTAIGQVSREMEEAASVSGLGRVRRQVRIMLPLLYSTILSAGLITFVAALSEVSGILLLASTETRTMSLLALDYLTQSRLEAAAVINCVVIMLAVAVALVSRAFGLRLGVGER